MSIQFPANREEVADKLRTDVQNELPESNPWLRNSFINALIVGLSGRVYEYYYQLDYNLLKELFPDTATGEFLERWGSYVNITRNPSTQAEGFISVVGTNGTIIPFDTKFQTSNGVVLETLAAATVATNTKSVSSLTRSGTTVTATTTTAHTFATGMTITIAGAVETDYNGSFEIVVTSATTFTYEITATPSTPATGTITAAADMASISVQSDDFGLNTNVDAGSQITITSPIAGLNDTAFVQYGGIAGGADLESDDDFRVRVLDRWQNPVAHFNVQAIINKAKEITGVTRVWVEENTPALGQVTIYFMRGSSIPTAGEIEDVKNKILEIKPANTTDANVIVGAPTPITINFNFTSLTPNTTDMQNAITESLQQLFAEGTNVGENLSRFAYESAIYNTVDTVSGDRVSAFSLSVPAGDVAIASGELAVLGTVTYP